MKYFTNLPRKGWHVVTVNDLGCGNTTCCEFCGTEIRYVHEISHADVPEIAMVGCECASNLSEGYKGKEEEKNFKKLQTWISSPRWKVTQKGNLRRVHNGFTFIIYQVGDGRFILKVDFDDKQTYKFESIKEAKEYAFSICSDVNN